MTQDDKVFCRGRRAIVHAWVTLCICVWARRAHDFSQTENGENEIQKSWSFNNIVFSFYLPAAAEAAAVAAAAAAVSHTCAPVQECVSLTLCRAALHIINYWNENICEGRRRNVVLCICDQRWSVSHSPSSCSLQWSDHTESEILTHTNIHLRTRSASRQPASHSESTLLFQNRKPKAIIYAFHTIRRNYYYY